MTAPKPPGPGSPSALRAVNQGRIEEALRSAGSLSQADLARFTGLSAATVSNVVRRLESEGTVDVQGGPGGRRTVRLAAATGQVVGIDYGHRHVTVVLANAAHEILAEDRADFDRELTAEAGIELTGSLVTRVLDSAGVGLDSVDCAAMGLPAPIDSSSGRVGSPTILPGWVGIPVRELAEERLGLRVEIDNDANMGALAEHLWGAGVGQGDMAYLKLSEGVGAGLILNGLPYGGPAGTAGEVGHVTLDEMGEVCRCGNRGCLETFVSARRVVSLLAPLYGPDLTITEIVRRADNGDRACARVLSDVGLRVGRAIADLCSLLSPNLVVVGGELAQAHTYVLPSIRQVVARCSVPAAGMRLQVKPAALGARAHVLGAVGLALNSSRTPTTHRPG